MCKEGKLSAKILHENAAKKKDDEIRINRAEFQLSYQSRKTLSLEPRPVWMSHPDLGEVISQKVCDRAS
jgi:hypothetical protein